MKCAGPLLTLKVLVYALTLGFTISFAQEAKLPALQASQGAEIGGEQIEHIGPKDGVTAPVLLLAPQPEYSKEARKKKVTGDVLVYLQVGTDGLPSKVRIVRGIGYGLDEKAMEAVSGYRFKPATKNGLPVRVEMNVQVNFRIFGKAP